MAYSKFKRNTKTTKLVNKFKSVKEKIIRTKASITFLIRCRNSGIIPKFIINSTKNLISIFNSNKIHEIHNYIKRYTTDFHTKMLKLMIKEKHEILKHFQRELMMVKELLKRYFTTEEIEEFLQYEDRLSASFSEKVKNIHRKKFICLQNLQRRELGIRFNQKWFVNKTDLNIPTDVQWTLSLGHKHALPIRREEFPTLKVITDGEDFIQTLQGKERQEIARTKLTTIIDNHLNKMRLTNRDRFMLDRVDETNRFLKSNRDLLIVKADKGNTTVALKKQDYEIRMNNIVGDETQYKLVNKDPTNRLQKMNNDIVEELFRKNIVTINEKNKLKTNIATAPRLYGLPKIHKENFPLRPICSFVNSPCYELCKYVTNILKKMTAQSEYNIKDSLQFKSRIKGQHIRDDEKLISLDVVSLFPSIPVDLAMDIIREKWSIIEGHTEIDRELFLRILKFCIEDNRYFQYSGKTFIQQKGLPMGSPASPIIADIVMEKLLDDCIGKLFVKPRLMTKYVDDLFCIISESSIDNMLETFNNFDPSIKFTIEREFDSKISYLDTLIIRKDKNLLIDWYQKPTASGRIINFYSKHSRHIIENTAKNLIDRVLKISDERFHRKNKRIIRDILRDNSFPNSLIYKLINRYKDRGVNNLDDMREPKIYKSLTYIPVMSERLKKAEVFDTEKYGVAYKNYNTLDKLFSKTKDKIEKWDMSNLVYKIPCKGNDTEDCDKVYIGTTKNKLKTRIAGHKSDQRYRDINSQRTALSSHCSELDHYPNFENVSVLNKEKNYKRRYMLEMLQIINVQTTQRINFKADTDNIAQNYRHLICKK